MISTETLHEYESLIKSNGWVRLPDRTLIELTGNDRCNFLHNFCTADINNGANGEVRELFVLDSRGKTMAFGHVFFRSESLWISVANFDVAETLREHLDRYIIQDNVVVRNRSTEYSQFFLPGNEVANALGDQVPTLKFNQTCDFEIAGVSAVLAKLELAGLGYHFLVPIADADTIATFFADAEIDHCSVGSLEMLRIEHATPWFGREVDGSNLPQELRRDDKAISFTKGCYLGQETVAKIDAFGHVNKFLVLIETQDKTVQPDQEIQMVGKKIGVVKSVAYSPSRKRNLLFGFVKCKYAEASTEVSFDDSGDSMGTIIDI